MIAPLNHAGVDASVTHDTGGTGTPTFGHRLDLFESEKKEFHFPVELLF